MYIMFALGCDMKCNCEAFSVSWMKDGGHDETNNFKNKSFFSFSWMWMDNPCTPTPTLRWAPVPSPTLHQRCVLGARRSTWRPGATWGNTAPWPGWAGTAWTAMAWCFTAPPAGSWTAVCRQTMKTARRGRDVCVCVLVGGCVCLLGNDFFDSLLIYYASFCN